MRFMYSARFIAPVLLALLLSVFVGISVKSQLFEREYISISPPTPGVGTTTGANAQENYPGVSLGEEQMFPAASSSVRITGIITDSRCPIGAECIWAGTVRASAVLIEGEDEHVGELNLGTTTRIGNTMITLREVFPPKSNVEIPIDQYRFDLVLEQAPKDIPEGDSGVHGYIFSGPSCPVVREGEECPDKPAAAVEIVVTRADSSVAARTSTKSDGSFLVLLPPGAYAIAKGDGVPFPAFAPEPVQVLPGEITEIIIRGDSGIR